MESNEQDQKQNSKNQVLLKCWEEMPKHLQFNPHIRSGYRPLMTPTNCVRSIFFFHNETVNILTHGESIVIWKKIFSLIFLFLTCSSIFFHLHQKKLIIFFFCQILIYIPLDSHAELLKRVFILVFCKKKKEISQKKILLCKECGHKE